MFVKAIKLGFYDTAKTGGFMEIKPGTVFEVPDNFKAAWVVECDQKGRVIQRSEIEKTLKKLLLDAETAEREADLAVSKAKQKRAAYVAEKKNFDASETEAKKAKEPPKEPPKEPKATEPPK